MKEKFLTLVQMSETVFKLGNKMIAEKDNTLYLELLEDVLEKEYAFLNSFTCDDVMIMESYLDHTYHFYTERNFFQEIMEHHSCSLSELRAYYLFYRMVKYYDFQSISCLNEKEAQYFSHLEHIQKLQKTNALFSNWLKELFYECSYPTEYQFLFINKTMPYQEFQKRQKVSISENKKIIETILREIYELTYAIGQENSKQIEQKIFLLKKLCKKLNFYKKDGMNKMKDAIESLMQEKKLDENHFELLQELWESLGFSYEKEYSNEFIEEIEHKKLTFYEISEYEKIYQKLYILSLKKWDNYVLWQKCEPDLQTKILEQIKNIEEKQKAELKKVSHYADFLDYVCNVYGLNSELLPFNICEYEEILENKENEKRNLKEMISLHTVSFIEEYLEWDEEEDQEEDYDLLEMKNEIPYQKLFSVMARYILKEISKNEFISYLNQFQIPHGKEIEEEDDEEDISLNLYAISEGELTRFFLETQKYIKEHSEYQKELENILLLIIYLEPTFFSSFISHPECFKVSPFKGELNEEEEQKYLQNAEEEFRLYQDEIDEDTEELKKVTYEIYVKSMLSVVATEKKEKLLETFLPKPKVRNRKKTK